MAEYEDELVWYDGFELPLEQKKYSPRSGGWVDAMTLSCLPHRYRDLTMKKKAKRIEPVWTIGGDEKR